MNMFSATPATAAQFRTQMLTESILALKMNRFLDNFDAERYGGDGLDGSVFYANSSAYWFEWFNENYLNLYRVYELLGDETSKRLYQYLIAFRLAGHHSIKIPVDFSENSPQFDAYQLQEKSMPSEFSLSGSYGALKHYDFNYSGKRYVVDCLGLKYYLFRNQYFYVRDGLRIEPSEGEHVIDGGACLGDSGIVFANAVGPAGRVYCFDPVLQHLEALSLNAKQNSALDIRVMPYGLSDVDVNCEPLSLTSYNPGFRSQGNQVPLRAIDSLVMDSSISKIDYIKLDIEGAEMAALRGAASSIRKFKPKLGVSLYHKPNDLWEIPLYIHEQFGWYQFHVAHYTIHNEETVLYCIAG